ncbi:MAG: hypothetical protein KDD37_03890, partial [Bdellovibrionales bacterium]|nr:hypothetical protein [Bdellovibrionales bacterium]
NTELQLAPIDWAPEQTMGDEVQFVRIKKGNRPYYISSRSQVDEFYTGSSPGTIDIHTQYHGSGSLYITNIAPNKSAKIQDSGIIISNLGVQNGIIKVSINNGRTSPCLVNPSIRVDLTGETSNSKTYNVVVKNNNATSCANATYLLNTILPKDINGHLAKANITIGSQKEQSIALTLDISKITKTEYVTVNVNQGTESLATNTFSVISPTKAQACD